MSVKMQWPMHWGNLEIYSLVNYLIDIDASNGENDMEKYC